MCLNCSDFTQLNETKAEKIQIQERKFIVFHKPSLLKLNKTSGVNASKVYSFPQNTDKFRPGTREAIAEMKQGRIERVLHEICVSRSPSLPAHSISNGINSESQFPS
jgi:hypothetical protein